MPDDKVYGEPSYYQLLSNILLPKKLYHPLVSTDCYLLTYKSSALTDPNVRPLCKYHYAGIRKYIFDDTEYYACDIDKRLLEERAQLLYRSQTIDNYKEILWWLGRVPSNFAIHEGNMGQRSRSIAAAISLIENGAEEYQKVCVSKCK